MVNFWRTVNENESMNWTVSNGEITMLYYFNDENTDSEKFLSLLNESAEINGLWQHGWELLSFRMQVPNTETWNKDYFKRIEFICRK